MTDTSSTECILCDALRDLKNPSNCVRNSDLYGCGDFLESASVLLVPDINPIVPGHRLIVTRDHFASFAVADKSIWDDLAQVREAAVLSLKNPSKGYFYFEHGAAVCQSPYVGCIAHAHIHMIPIRIDMSYYLRPYTTQPLKFAPIDMMNALPRTGCDYWYFEDENGMGCMITGFRRHPPRQFVRMVVAAELDLDEWDWRSFTTDSK